MCGHICAWEHRGPLRSVGSSEAGITGSCKTPSTVQRTKLRFSTRTAPALNCWAIFLSSLCWFNNLLRNCDGVPRSYPQQSNSRLLEPPVLHLIGPSKVGSSPFIILCLPRQGNIRQTLVQIFPLDGISDDAVFLPVSCHPVMVSPSRALADLLRLSLPHSTGLQILITFRTMLVDGAKITMWSPVPQNRVFTRQN